MTADGGELSLQIDGDGSHPTTVMTLKRSTPGRVLVRQWTSADWQNAREVDRDAAEVWREIESAHHARRRVSAELIALKQFLGV